MAEPGVLPLEDSPATAVDHTIARGVEQLAARQNPDGSWDGDYGGPMFLLPMYVAVFHVGGRRIPAVQRRGMVRYI